MSTDTLEPGLTKADQRVLAAVPACGSGDEYRKRGTGETVTMWQVAEALDTIEIHDLVLTLNGLEHLGYVRKALSKSRKQRVFWRTPKGDKGVAA